MLVLNKRKIRMIVLGIFVLVFGFAFICDKKESVPTVSLPVSGKTIVIDAGHGKPDEGAQSNNGTTEAETNLKIAIKLQNLLEQSGSTVILTRSDDNAIYDINAKTLKQKKISDIQLTKSKLMLIKNLIGNLERLGIVHILVNDETIKSWVAPYEE